MAVIKESFGTGGSGLTPGSSGDPSLAQILRDIADDLAALSGGSSEVEVGDELDEVIGAALSDAIGAALADVVGADLADAIGADLGAFTDPPSAGEMATLRSRVNEIRAAVLAAQTRVNEIRAAVLAAQTRVNEIRAAELADQTRVNQIREAVLAAQALVNELRELALETGPGGVELLTSKG